MGSWASPTPLFPTKNSIKNKDARAQTVILEDLQIRGLHAHFQDLHYEWHSLTVIRFLFKKNPHDLQDKLLHQGFQRSVSLPVMSRKRGFEIT